MEFSIYVALGAITLAGISSMYTTLVCLRELSSFDRQVMRIDKLIARLEDHLQNPDRGGQ